MSKSARACNACYDTVFPVIESSSSEAAMSNAASGSTLSSFPSWKTAKPIAKHRLKPSELMALEGSSPSRSSPRKQTGQQVIRKSRPLSHPVIPQEFKDVSPGVSPTSSSHVVHLEGESDVFSTTSDDEIRNLSLGKSSGAHSSGSPSTESTLRSKKRFSMPAIALQTTSVTARPNIIGEGQSKRFSLVLGGSRQRNSSVLHSRVVTNSEQDREEAYQDTKGVAAAKLTELLARSRSKSPGDGMD